MDKPSPPQQALPGLIVTRIRRSIANVTSGITQQPKIQQGLAVKLDKRSFVVTWGIILFFHLFNAAYTTGIAFIYIFLREPLMQYYVSLVHMLPTKTFIGIAIVHIAIGFLNFMHAVVMVTYSIRYRTLVFKKRLVKSVKEPGSPKKRRRWCICLPRSVTRFLSRYSSALSIEGQLFDIKVRFRELMEIASQTYQAYSSSLLVSDVWINQLFGAIVYFNCTSNVAVYIYKAETIGMRRFVKIAIDLLLDFAWAFIIPGKILLHYLPKFIKNEHDIPYDYVTSDFLMIQAILDCRQFFAISWIDAFTTVLPYLSMLEGLSSMKTLLQIEEPDQRDLESARADTDSANTDTQTDEEKTAKPSNIGTSREQPKKSCIQRKHLALFVPLFGLAVLFTSMTASGVFSNGHCTDECKLPMRPWFTTACACSVLEINCYDRKISGNASELSNIFQTLDRRVLNLIIFTHCPALSMSSDYQQFDELIGLEFYNVTFVNWTRDAAVTDDKFPILNHIYIARSNIGAWPEGLTYKTTSALTDVEISASVIDPPPDDLDVKWKSVKMFYFDFCDLQDFPMVLTRMKVTDVSLVGNKISVIPENLPSLAWMYIYLDRNPLLRLPDKVEGFPKLVAFSIQDTNITSLPQWLLETKKLDSKTHVNAYLTQMCANVQVDKKAFLRCGMNPNTINGGFALRDKDRMRRITEAAVLPADIKFYL